MLIRGADLTTQQRQQVLSAFIYRWTRDNPQRTRVYRCALCDIHQPYVNTQSSAGHTHPTIPLITDTQWLARYAFDFIASGERLSARQRHAVPVAMLVDTTTEAA